MNNLVIEPFQSCGPISRDDEYADISKRFSDHQSFMKNSFSNFLTSSIFGGNLHVFYSSEGKCVGVEAFPPMNVSWDGFIILPGCLIRAKEFFERRLMKVDTSDYGLEIVCLGLSIYSYDFEESLNCNIDSLYISFDEKK